MFSPVDVEVVLHPWMLEQRATLTESYYSTAGPPKSQNGLLNDFKMITPEPDLHLAALLDGERARGKTTADALLNPIEWTRTVSCARRALCLFVCLFAVLWLSRKLDKR